VKRLAIAAALFAILAAASACKPSNTGEPMPLTTEMDKIAAETDKKYGGSSDYKKLSPKEKWQCLLDGGEEFPGMGGIVCLRPTVDAGKKCKTSKDCEVFCLAKTLTCSTITPPEGCYEFIGKDGNINDGCLSF
jgi:hypothetical protein